jgi:hypothetical protein
VPASGGLLTDRAAIRSSAFSFDVGKAGLLSRGDLFGVRLSQPLRVSGGGLTVRLPVGYDYATKLASFADQRLNLAPAGRELAMEASYSRMFFGGRIDTNLFWRQDPGHFATAPDDLGAALRWRTDF